MAPAAPGLDVGVSTLTNTRYQLEEGYPIMENSPAGYYYQSVFRDALIPFLRRRLPLIYLPRQTRQSITFQHKKYNGQKKGMERKKIGYILKVLKVLSDDIKDGFSEWSGMILWARSITHKLFFVLGKSKKS